MTMTNREFFETVIELSNGKTFEAEVMAELAAKAEHQIEILSHKSTSRKPSANQIENVEVIRPAILEVMKNFAGGAKVADIVPLIEGGYSTSRISANMTALVKEGALTCNKEKKVNVYFLA